MAIRDSYVIPTFSIWPCTTSSFTIHRCLQVLIAKLQLIANLDNIIYKTNGVRANYRFPLPFTATIPLGYHARRNQRGHDFRVCITTEVTAGNVDVLIGIGNYDGINILFRTLIIPRASVSSVYCILPRYAHFGSGGKSRGSSFSLPEGDRQILTIDLQAIHDPISVFIGAACQGPGKAVFIPGERITSRVKRRTMAVCSPPGIVHSVVECLNFVHLNTYLNIVGNLFDLIDQGVSIRSRGFGCFRQCLTLASHGVGYRCLAAPGGANLEVQRGVSSNGFRAIIGSARCAVQAVLDRIYFHMRFIVEHRDSTIRHNQKHRIIITVGIIGLSVVAAQVTDFAVIDLRIKEVIALHRGGSSRYIACIDRSACRLTIRLTILI